MLGQYADRTDFVPRHEHQHAHAHGTHRDGVPVKVRSDLVAFTRADCMALGTPRLEKLSAALSVTYGGSLCENKLPKGVYGRDTHRELEALLLKGVTSKGKKGWLDERDDGWNVGDSRARTSTF